MEKLSPLRADYFAETPLALRRPWPAQRVLQTPTSVSSVSGHAELRYQLPPDVCGGQELVLETPRGTLVDVTVPHGAGPGAELVVRYVPMRQLGSGQRPASETPEGAGVGLSTGGTERQSDRRASPGVILDAPPAGRKRATGAG